MNICLTSVCNNHCPYCFQEEFRRDAEWWSIEDLKHLLTWIGPNRTQLTLLGGEPTLYPFLDEFLTYVEEEVRCHRNNIRDILFITNLLGPDESIQRIASCSIPNVHILINSTYDDKNQELFEKHLDYISAYNQLDVCISITLFPNRKFNEKYIERAITYLSNEKYRINSFRIGFMTPKSTDKLTEIYNYDDEIILLFSKIKECHIYKNIHFDCPVNFCQMSPEIFQILTQFPNVTQLKTQCHGMPLDIWPDHSAVYCSSSTGEFISHKYEEFPNGDECERALEYLDYKYVIKNHKCRNCELFINNICHPCHSFDQALLRGEGVDT